MEDSVTLTGANAEAVDGSIKDTVRITLVGKITRMSVHEPYGMPEAVTSDGKKPKPKGKTEAEVTIGELEVDECECDTESEADDSEEETGKDGIPAAVKKVAKKL